MKNLKITLTILLLFATTLSYSQDYNLNNYKYRYQKYRGMGANLSFDQSYRNNVDTSNSQKEFKLRIPPSIEYLSVVNTDRLQKSSLARAGLDFGYRSYKRQLGDTSINDNVEESNTSFGYYGSFSETNLFYQDKNNFWLLDYSIRFDNRLNKITSLRENQLEYLKKYDAQTKMVGMFSDVGLKLGYGLGRLEYVTDAVDALFILKDLERKKGATFDASAVEALAKAITHIRSQRYIDFRFRYIDQIKALDSALASQGYETKDIDFFTTITDNWLYNRSFQRFAGDRLTFSLSSGSQWDRFIENTNQRSFYQTPSDTSIQSYRHSKDNYLNPEASINVDYENYKQQSLYVQRMYGFHLNHGLERNNSYSYKLESNQPIVEYKDTTKFVENILTTHSTTLEAEFGYLIQPNSRNFIDIKARVQGTKFHNSNFADPAPKIDYSVKIPVGVSYYRFVNQFLAFNVAFGGDFVYIKYLDQNKNTPHLFTPSAYNTMFFQSFQAGVTYYLF